MKLKLEKVGSKSFGRSRSVLEIGRVSLRLVCIIILCGAATRRWPGGLVRAFISTGPTIGYADQNSHFNFVGSAAARGSSRRATVKSSSADDSHLADRIYELAGREFDIGKPAVLSKVLFDEVRVFDPNALSVPQQSLPVDGGGKSKNRTSSSKVRSVSVKSLQEALQGEKDPGKRKLLSLILDWLNAKAVARRGGFIACGEKVADRPDWQSRIIPDHDELKTDPDAPSLIVVDGHNIIFRSFHALPHLTAADGTPVGAVVGFCSIMNRLVLQPWADGSEPQRRVVVAFDTGDDNFRHALYPGYKAGRPDTPEELKPQFALVRQACEAYGFEVVRGPGFEADDVIAAVTLQAVNSGVTDVTIVSTDKDLAQLVTRRVELLNNSSGERLGPDEVLAKYLAPPGRLADLLAIAGDKSDGIKGADGYGPVNAAKVLAKHKTLEGAIDEICATLTKKKKDPAVVEETRARILLAREVVNLRTDVPLRPPRDDQSQQSVAGIRPVGEARYFQLGAGRGAGPLLDFYQRLGLQDLTRKTLRMLETVVVEDEWKL